MQRAKVVWNEKAFQGHQNRTRGQTAAMSLLLQVSKLPSPQKRAQVILRKERHFRKSDESAYSIVPSRMSQVSFESADLVYQRLSFEDDLFTATIYKRNYGNTLIRSLLQLRHRIEGTRTQNTSSNRGLVAINRSSFSISKGRDSELKFSMLKSAMQTSVLKGAAQKMMSGATAALRQAVALGNIDHVSRLLKRGAQINSVSLVDGLTPLHTAMRR